MRHEIKDRLPLRLGATVQPKPLYEDGDPAQHAKDHGEAIDRMLYDALRPKWVDPQLAGTERDLKHPSAPKPQAGIDFEDITTSIDAILAHQPVTLIVMTDGPAEYAIVTFSREMSAEDGRAMRLIVQHQGIVLAKGDRFEFDWCVDGWCIKAYVRAPGATSISMSPMSIEAYRDLVKAIEGRPLTMPRPSKNVGDTIKFRRRAEPVRIGFDLGTKEGDRNFVTTARRDAGGVWQVEQQPAPEPLVVGEEVCLRPNVPRVPGYCGYGKLVELTETHGVVALSGQASSSDPLGQRTRPTRYDRRDIESIPF